MSESTDEKKFRERMERKREERNNREMIEKIKASISNEDFEYETGDIVVVTSQKNRIGKIMFIDTATAGFVNHIMIVVNFTSKSKFYELRSFEFGYFSITELRKATPKEMEIYKATLVAEEL